MIVFRLFVLSLRFFARMSGPHSPTFVTTGCISYINCEKVAKVLRGKNKPIFTPHIDTGDYVIVVNAEKVKVTGKKLDQKIYYHHSDYVGGMKETTLKEMLNKHPERVVHTIFFRL